MCSSHFLRSQCHLKSWQENGICISEKKVARSKTLDAGPRESQTSEGNEDGRITGALF